jgi:hypothetical protein
VSKINQMNFTIFFKKGFYLFVILAIFLTIFILSGVVTHGKMAAWIGLILGFLNFIGGAAAISHAIPKSDSQFLTIFFGGMIIRFVFIFTTLFVLIKIFELDKITMIVVLFISYVSFLVLEIWQVHQHALAKGNDQ